MIFVRTPSFLFRRLNEQQLSASWLKVSWQRNLERRFCSVSYKSRYDEDVDEEHPLVEFKQAVLSYPEASTSTRYGPWNLSISSPTLGGHAVLGRNGTGKSLICNALVDYHRRNRNGEHNESGEGGFLKSGTVTTEQPWYSNSIAHVSFESHEAVLAKGGTVYKVISGGGNLTKAAQFLVVRFGLFPFLHRDVRTLSTGEIRKVLLVSALANRPRLLILDNAFDGLDVPSRAILNDLVSKTIQGFRPDILVQGVSAKATAHTQVLLLTHRAEEIVDEIETITSLQHPGKLQTMARYGMTGEDLLYQALGVGNEVAGLCPWDDPSLPSLDEIAAVWRKKKPAIHASTTSTADTNDDVLVRTSHLCIQRSGSTLIQDLTWIVQNGQRWLVAGGNGQGKSTLSRMLAKVEDVIEQGSFCVAMQGEVVEDDDHRRVGVGWVSTELHLATTRSTKTAMEVLRGIESADEDTVLAVASWLGINDHAILSRPFTELSQGQQKLVLIGAAIASRPSILVIDEPCQGLDLLNRRRVLGLVDRLCQATDVCLIYITHHPEEFIPSITHVLHLSNGSAAYNGPIANYDPSVI